MFSTALIALSFLAQQGTLPGSNASMEEAQEKAYLIVVAEPTGFGLMGSAGNAYGSAALKQSAVLKGRIEDKPLKVAGIRREGPEMLPEIGTEYIFFVHDYKGHPQIHKVMPRTDQNVEAVKREIKAKAAKP